MNGLGIHLHEDLLDGEPVWLEHGEGSPVVLVHGIPTSPRLWRHVLPLVGGRSLALEWSGTAARSPTARVTTSA